MSTTTVKRIERLDRLRDDKHGNHQYVVHFTDGFVGRTQPSAGWARSLTNAEYAYCDVAVTVSPQGFIEAIEPIDPRGGEDHGRQPRAGADRDGRHADLPGSA